MRKFFTNISKELNTLNYGVVALSRFGFLVGGIFLSLCALALYHDKALLALMVGTPGIILFALGAITPRTLGVAYRYWMGLAFFLGAIIGPVILSLVYFFVLTPISLLALLISGNPLEKKTKEGSYWIPRTDALTKESMERMF